MNNKQFKRKILQACWYDMYFYYLLSCALVTGGCYMLYRTYVDYESYGEEHSYALSAAVFSLMIVFGCYVIYKIPNRYKIITIQSYIAINKKREIIMQLQQLFALYLKKNEHTWYYFDYAYGVLKSGYYIHININDNNFYLSIQGQTTGRGGFLDLGGTERLRTKITKALKNCIAQPSV